MPDTPQLYLGLEAESEESTDTNLPVSGLCPVLHPTLQRRDRLPSVY